MPDDPLLHDISKSKKALGTTLPKGFVYSPTYSRQFAGGLCFTRS